MKVLSKQVWLGLTKRSLVNNWLCSSSLALEWCLILWALLMMQTWLHPPCCCFQAKNTLLFSLFLEMKLDLFPNAWEFGMSLVFYFDACCLWSSWLIFQQESEIFSENEDPIVYSWWHPDPLHKHAVKIDHIEGRGALVRALGWERSWEYGPCLAQGCCYQAGK